MRRSNREINIFSMSALDLFASALGAFMLLAVVFFPFFPNTGDDQGQVDKIKEQVAPAVEAADAAEKAANEAKKKQADAERNAKGKQAELDARKSKPIQFPDIDIVVALDTTGSMVPVVDSLKNEISSFVDLLNDWAPSVALGFVDFKDRCQQPTPFREFPLVIIDSTSLIGLRDFINNTQAGSQQCNQDYPEALGQALERSVNMPWRSIAKIKLVVVISDNAAYPGEIGSSLSLAERFEDEDKGQSISSVFVDGGSNPALGRDFLKQLAEAGGGTLVVGRGFTASILLILGKI